MKYARRSSRSPIDYESPCRLFARIRRCLVWTEHKLKKTLAWRWTRYIKQFGIIKGSRLFYSVYLKRRSGNFTVIVPGIREPIHIRPRTSDLATFSQIFTSNEYDLPLDIRASLIIDGGANVGYTTVYFANRFPGARIIAIEPEPSNVAMLRRNTAAYPNVVVLDAAIWKRGGTVSIENPADEKWAFRVLEANGGSPKVKAVTIREVLKAAGGGMIDILKLDIEGAEREVFSDCDDWLSGVRVLMVELHDHLKLGCSSTVYAATAKYQFNHSHSGTTEILVRS